MDINADIGEGYDDAGLMPYLTRVSIACGGHTGDAASMDTALTLAAEYGIAVGAHPSYPDREGFGRREWAATPEQIALWVRQQTETLAEIAAIKGMRLAHVKPHGALYHAAAQHEVIAAAIADAVADWDAELILVGFDVCEPHAFYCRNLGQCFCLLRDPLRDLRGRRRPFAPAKAFTIRIAGVRTDRNAVFRRERQCRVHAACIARMPAARNRHARQIRHQARIVVALADIGINIHDYFRLSNASVRAVSTLTVSKRTVSPGFSCAIRGRSAEMSPAITG